MWSFINADEEEEILVVVAVDRDSGRGVIIETGNGRGYFALVI